MNKCLKILNEKLWVYNTKFLSIVAISNRNSIQWIVFSAFAAVIFVKCVLFHWFCFHSLIISGIWKAPLEALIFYLPKVIVAMLLGSFVFLTKRYWWTVVLALAADMWSISNLMYHNANDLLIDVPAMLMATNLQGFESSLSAFFYLPYLLFLGTTLVLAVVVWWVGKMDKRRWKWFTICFALAEFGNLCFCVPDWISYYKDKADADFDMANGRKEIIELCGWNGWHYFIPFHDVRMNAMPLTYNPDYGPYYTYQNSILHYGVAMLVYYAYSVSDDLMEVTEGMLGNKYSSTARGGVEPDKNLIVVLVESLESWPFEMGEMSYQVAPNMMNFYENIHVSSWSRVRSQVKHGVSGDGQMLVNSGMMPIDAGAACMLYGDNVWPSYVSLYDYSAFVDIANGIWNQRTMTRQYGYKNDLYDPAGKWGDKSVFEQLRNVVDTIGEPFVSMVLTGATHSPFDHHDGYRLNVPSDIPKYMRDYLECLHVTDMYFGEFWEWLKKSGRLENTIVVVTGDHTAFKSAMLKDFHAYAQNHGLSIAADESYCPLWIYSMTEEVTKNNTLCYQMDIYPTILAEIGCEEFYWRGFGENLRDSAALQNRMFSEVEAYEVSNSIIKQNWFNK
ncbi:MAG: sulfatase-like hydrolase/transferase [Bacteroidales bacterium]|nr:sulfatase-like hydrolase/transferase [Bacteroidales bacterium]